MDRRLLTGFGVMGALTLQQLSPDTIHQIVAGLSLFQFITLLISGSVLLDWLKFEGWRKKIPVYVIKCEKHGYQLSYPSGYMKTLFCPKCIQTNES